MWRSDDCVNPLRPLVFHMLRNAGKVWTLDLSMSGWKVLQKYFRVIFYYFWSEGIWNGCFGPKVVLSRLSGIVWISRQWPDTGPLLMIFYSYANHGSTVLFQSRVFFFGLLWGCAKSWYVDQFTWPVNVDVVFQKSCNICISENSGSLKKVWPLNFKCL